MSDLRASASSAPSSSAPAPLALKRERRRSPARTMLRVTLCALPWILLGAACLDNDDGGDDLSGGGDDGVGQGTMTNAGAGGTTQMGTAGGANLPAGGAGGTGGSGAQTANGGSGAVGGSSSMMGGGGGELGSLPAEPGESGVFVGMTAAHNAIRATVDVDPPLPDLTWSEELADFAQQWADNLASAANCGTIFHRDQRMYGENIATRGSTGSIAYSAEEAVESWAAEIECWEYGTILGNNAPTANSESCDPVCIDMQHSSGCGHYTQLVWRNTREVGCGYAQCNDGRFNNALWVCNYNPPGNFINQTPY